MKPTARILSALLAAAMLLPSQALAAETAPEAAAAAVTAEAPQSEFAVTFAAEHAGVDVYYTHDYTKADEENVSAAFAQNSDTGEIDTTGDGQVNFRLRPEEGYEIVSVTADQNYKNLKGADDTGVEGIYRLTKVKGPVTVTVITKESGGGEQPEEPVYTPVITGEERVQGFCNDTAALRAELAGRYNSGAMSADGGSLEIVQYNAENGFAYAVSGVKGKLIAVDLNASLSGDKAAALNGTEYDIRSLVRADNFTYGDMTSVAVSPDGGTLAAAIQAEDYTASGIVAVFTCGADGSLTLRGTVSVGVQPDMVTFTPDGKYILTADEGEPRMGYTAEGAVDPKGSVTVIEAADLSARTVDFTAFDSAGARAALAAEGVVLKKDTAPSVDLEPEYIACDNDTAYITCQEANAIAVLDIAKGEFTGVWSVGFEDYSQVPVDLGNDDKTYAPSTYEDLKGIRMPDAVSLYQVNGTTYLITANEGDSRTWPVGLETDVNESKSKKSPNGKTFEKKVTWFDASQYDGLESGVDYLFGGRSFSVLRVTETGLEEVYDSGSAFEAITAKHFPDFFNCSNDNIDLEDRSGKKGPEPEGTAVGAVNGRTYAFIALERIGGVMIYDITDPAKAEFVNYINSREFAADIQGDVSPEGLCFVPAAESKTGKPLLLAACEVSGTLAVYELTGKSSGGNSGSGGSGTPAPAEPEKPAFPDVPADSPYADAIRWAVEQGITNGVTEDLFQPNGTCTRGQAVTFLWRAAGSPEPKGTEMPFTDVASGSYCEKAVLWAVENGITNGTTATTFSPNAGCTRAQIVALICRSQQGTPAAGYLPFTDAPAWAYDAIAWSYQQGIVKGTTETTFSPNALCTRGQIVTFLYRLAEG